MHSFYPQNPGQRFAETTCRRAGLLLPPGVLRTRVADPSLSVAQRGFPVRRGWDVGWSWLLSPGPGSRPDCRGTSRCWSGRSGASPSGRSGDGGQPRGGSVGLLDHLIWCGPRRGLGLRLGGGRSCHGYDGPRALELTAEAHTFRRGLFVKFRKSPHRTEKALRHAQKLVNPRSTNPIGWEST